MNPLLKRVALFAGVALLVVAAVSVAGVAPAAVHFIDHDKVAATFAKSGTIIDEPGLKVVTQRRDGGMAEYHEHTGHVFIMYDGEGTLVVGGTIVDGKTTAPGQIRGDSIEGGRVLPCEQGRRDYDSSKDAALVQGPYDKDHCLLCGELRERLTLAGLLYRYGLRQVARLIHIAAAPHGDMVGEQLQWDDLQQWREQFDGRRHDDDVVGSLARQVIAFADD